jgi:hypothetical protein
MITSKPSELSYSGRIGPSSTAIASQSLGRKGYQSEALGEIMAITDPWASAT